MTGSFRWRPDDRTASNEFSGPSGDLQPPILNGWRRDQPAEAGWFFFYQAGAPVALIDHPILLEVVTTPRFVAFSGGKAYTAHELQDGWWHGPIAVPDGWQTLEK